MGTGVCASLGGRTAAGAGVGTDLGSVGAPVEVVSAGLSARLKIHAYHRRQAT